MAEFNTLIADLEELITCGICSEFLKIPKTLSCSHTCCFKCLEDLYQQCQADRKPFKCPSCRSTMPIQGDDVNNLPTSFEHYTFIELYNTFKAGKQYQAQPCSSCSNCQPMVGFCFYCGGMLCNICFSMHNMTEQSHKAILWHQVEKQHLISYIDNKFFCPVKYHEKCHLDYYCEQCKKTICQKCVTTAHSNHDIVSLGAACEQIQHSIRQEKHRLQDVVKMHENEQKLSDENRERIQNHVHEVEARVLDDLQAKINIMQEKVNACRATLRRHLDNQIQDNDEERNAIDNALEQARSLREQCDKLDNSNLKHFIVKGHENLVDICQTTVKGTPILPTRPVNRYSSIFYVPNPEALQILQGLEIGKVIESMTDPSRCTIESVRDARCGFENNFNIITRDCKGNPYHTDESLIDVQIQDIDGNHVNKEITQSQPGTYIVTYKASIASAYILEVTIGGMPVSNSPQVAQTVDATAELEPVKVIQTHGTSWSSAVAVNDSDLIAVTYKPAGVVLYNADGELLKEFGKDIAAEGEARLHDPCGVAFTKNNCILITDKQVNHSMIKLFDINANYKRLVHKEKGMIFTRMCTTNQTIACLAYNKNSKESLIELFSDPSYDHIKDIAIDIHDAGVPLYIAYDSNKYFVTFSNSHSIRVFDERGLLLNTYGEKGNKEGQFNYPRGLAVFGADMLLVCDCNNHRVQLLHQDGRFLSSFVSRGSGLGQMYEPKDVAVTPDGQVIALEGQFSESRLRVLK